MKYDFTSILDRRGKDAAAYDNGCPCQCARKAKGRLLI